MSIVNKTLEKITVAINRELTKRLAELTVEFVEFRSILKAQENINQKLEDKISEQNKEIEKFKNQIEILENENKILKSEIKLTEFYT